MTYLTAQSPNAKFLVIIFRFLSSNFRGELHQLFLFHFSLKGFQQKLELYFFKTVCCFWDRYIHRLDYFCKERVRGKSPWKFLAQCTPSQVYLSQYRNLIIIDTLFKYVVCDNWKINFEKNISNNTQANFLTVGIFVE